MKKVYIETLGCSKNQVDSEIMSGILSQSYQITTNPNYANIIIVNTCSFIHDAKEESIETIFDLLQCKEQGSCEIFIVAGCMAERYADELVKEIPEVDIFIGTTKFEKIAKHVKAFSGETIVAVGDISTTISEELPRNIENSKHFAYLKIAEGCDNHCTYCIIPKLRGKFRSRKIEDLVKETKILAKQGVREIIIIAQDTTRYGIDLYGEYKLIDLLNELSQVDGIEWIRLQYCYPDIVDETFIQGIKANEKVVNYFDIPIQHISDNILKLMNRRTTKAHISNVIEMIRKNIPDAVIRTTLITGFPGETEDDFRQLLEFVKKAKFDRLGVFSYSPEEDTAAYNLPNQIDDSIKDERRIEILKTQQKISEDIMKSHVGKEYNTVIDEKIDEQNVYIGRTKYDTPEVDGIIYVNSTRQLEIGSVVNVIVTDALEYELIGDVKDELAK